MGSVMLRFYPVPPEHRVVVTSTDVKAATGKYFVRLFGGESHAKVSDGARPHLNCYLHSGPSKTQRPISQARACSVASRRGSSPPT